MTEYLEKRKPPGYCPTCHVFNYQELPVCIKVKKRYQDDYYMETENKYCCEKCGTKWVEINTK